MLAMQRGRPRSQPQCVGEFMDRQCMYHVCQSARTLVVVVVVVGVSCCMSVVSFSSLLQ